MERRTRAVLVFLALAMSIGCAKIPPHTFEPSSIADAVAPPAVQTVTTLAVSGINLAPFAPQITNAVPPEIASQRFPGGGMPNPSYRFKKQSAQLLLSEGRLLIKASYTGQIEVVENVLGAVPVPCRLEPVNVDLRITARPQLVRDGNAWYLTARNAAIVPSVAAGSDTRCGAVPPLVANVRQEMQVRLKDAVLSYQQELDKLRMPLPIADITDVLNGPLAIEINPKSRVCVYPRVTGISLGAISGLPLRCVGQLFCNAVIIPNEEETADSVRLSLMVSAAPTAVATTLSCPAGSPPPGGVAQLPDVPQPQPFRLLAAVGADYPTLSETLTSELSKIKGSRGKLRPFQVERIRVGDAGGQVLVQIDVKGFLSGSLYFWGQPALVENRKKLVVADLQLAAASRTLLERIDLRLPDLLVNLFKPTLQQQLTFDVDELKKPLEQEISNEGIRAGTTSISLGKFQADVLGVRSTSSSLLVDVVLIGSAELSVTLAP